MAMKTCPGCGRVYSDAMTSAVCPKCGTSLSGAVPPQPKAPQTKAPTPQPKPIQAKTPTPQPKPAQAKAPTPQYQTSQSTQQQTQAPPAGTQKGAAASGPAKSGKASKILGTIATILIIAVIRTIFSGGGSTVKESDIISTTTHDKYVSLFAERGIEDKDYFTGKEIAFALLDFDGYLEKKEFGYSGDTITNIYHSIYYPADEYDLDLMMDAIEEQKSKYASETSSGLFDIVIDTYSNDDYYIIIEEYKKMDTKPGHSFYKEMFEENEDGPYSITKTKTSMALHGWSQR